MKYIKTHVFDISNKLQSCLKEIVKIKQKNDYELSALQKILRWLV
jgi:hypothetical protein